MRIEIQERYRPFSHLPGTICLVPGTFVSAQIFPAKVILHDLQDGSTREINFDFQGPIEPFTVETDLERGWIRVFGHAASGYFSYRIASENGKAVIIHKAEKKEFPLAQHQERLSLGITKKQEWERIKERMDLREIFPLWLKMASFAPEVKEKFPIVDLEKQFLSYFSGIFVPRRVDTDHQNLLPPLESIPFSLLSVGARYIRSLFFQEKEDTLIFLPNLPSTFISGRFTSLTFSLGTLSIEWSKKNLRRVMMQIERDGELILLLQNANTCRVRTSIQEKGTGYQSGTSLSLKKGVVYLDRFSR